MAKEYNIARATGRCGACDRELQPGEEFVATVRELPDDLRREDFCLSCWEAHPRDEAPDPRGPHGLLGLWHSRVPKKQEKRRLFVDDELLVNFFERLAGPDVHRGEPVKASFRFVLALVLMRKKLLVYDRSEKLDGGREVWSMHLKGSDRTHEVLNPQMDEDRIAEVSGQLGQILEAEL